MRNMLLAGLLALATPALSAGEGMLADDTGVVLRLSAPVDRVVALAPHLAELMFDIGAGDLLAGTVEWSDHPPAAKAVPRIGDSFRIDFERVLALEPDVVLAWGGGTPLNTIDRLRELGVPVAVLTPSDLASIPRHLEWLGRLTGREAAAMAQAAAFRAALGALRREFAHTDRIRVFYQVSDQPLFTVGHGHTISELIAICGGENIFSDLDARAHAVSREAVVARDPEAIIAGRYAGNESGLARWREWGRLAAVRAGNLFSIEADRVARPTSEILRGGRELCTTFERARRNLGEGELPQPDPASIRR